MAIEVIEDLVNGHETEESKDESSLVRVFKVRGLTRGTRTLIQARQAVPLFYGNPHPDDPNLKVVSKKAMPALNSRDQAKVLVTYKTEDNQNGPLPEGGVIRFHGGTREIETERYADGSLITVNYTDDTTSYEPQIGRVSQPERFGVLEFAKEHTVDPEPFLYLLGGINNATYRGKPKWSWMCTDFEAEYLIYRNVYRAAVRLEWREQGWWTPVMWTDKVTGLVPKSIIEAYNEVAVGPNGPPQTGNGWVIKLLGPEVDFGQFGIP